MVSLIKLVLESNIFYRIRCKRRELNVNKRAELNHLFDLVVESDIKYTASGRIRCPYLTKFQLRIEKLNKQYWDVEHYFLLLNQYKEDL